ncbi:MAG: glycosyltransferase family protein [Bacteroidales bacterium]|nr:glycosyltransferase family protein [Bacteroidales bacterium]
MNQKIIAVIQARMGSTRLPGKSLLKVYKSFSLLELVLMRVKQSEQLDQVILATSEDKNCDPLEKIADSLGVVVIRGSEENVLSRFVTAIKLFQPEAVVRVCADNPLVSPEEIDKLIDFFSSEHLEYAANNAPECGLPDGLGVEIISAKILKKIDTITDEPLDREHVTRYIMNRPEIFKIAQLKVEDRLMIHTAKLDIDTAKDLKKMRFFCRQLPEENAPYWTSLEIINCLKSKNMGSQ